MAALRNGDEKGIETALSAADRQMLAYATRLARDPRSVTRDDLEALRAVGFDDAAILEIVHVVGFFSYYNRLADGLGIDPEPEAPDA